MMDRRRTYVDVMERVLGIAIPSGAPDDTVRAPRDLDPDASTIGTAVSEVQVLVLDDRADRPR